MTRPDITKQMEILLKILLGNQDQGLRDLEVWIQVRDLGVWIQVRDLGSSQRTLDQLG